MSPQLQAVLQQAIQAFQDGNFIKAEEALKYFLNVKPTEFTALHLLAIVYASQNKHDTAIEWYKKALEIVPDDASILSNYASSLSATGLIKEALNIFRKVLEINPSDPMFFYNIANTFCELGRYEEALFYYEQSIQLDPQYFQAHNNYGKALYDLKRFSEALTFYDHAILINPFFIDSMLNKGACLNELKRYDEAIAHYDKALSLKPDIDWTSGDLLHTKMKICSWSGLIESLENISKKVVANEKVATPFPLLALNDDALLHKKSSEIYIQSKYLFNPVLGPILKYPKNKKIRVGYFSADFKNHPVSLLTAELYELHDKNQFEIIAFSFGVDDKSPMRLRLSQAFDQYIDVSDMSDLEIAELARNLKIDIAVDLGGFTSNSRTGIFSYRAAPIQLSYIGYLGTMGAEYYDYLLADKTIVSTESQKFYSEKIAYLPSYQVNDRKRIISDRQFTRVELGLPENGFIFCCFNNNYKILPAMFDSWMRILNAVEGSVLFLYAENDWAKANLIQEASLRGIDSARLIFGAHIPTEEYLARYRVCDLFLDTFPYNAGTTASDALWVGLPVLTLMGQSFASRMAASLLNAIGLPELITNTQAEYEFLAIELAMNHQKLRDIKLKLANNRLTAPLFDTPLFVKNIEAAYLTMVEQYQADLESEHIFVV